VRIGVKVRRNKRRVARWPAVAGAAAIAIALAACSSSSSSSSSSGSTSATASSVTWKLSSDLPTGVPFNDLYLKAAGSGISSATNGKVKVTEYPANELYSKQTLAISALETDQVQVVVTQALDVNSVMKAFDGTQVAYLTPTSADYFKVFAPGTPWFTEASSEAAKLGIKLVPIVGASPGEAGFGFTSKTPATSLGSLSGLKVRIAGAGIVSDELAKLGAHTVDLSTTEAASGLEDGTVSAALASASFAAGTLKGVIHGFYDPGTFQYGPYFMFVNMKAWNAIGATSQNAIASEVNSQVQSYVTNIAANQQTARQTLTSQGLWVNTATAGQVQQFGKELQPFALSIFQKEDPASYQALVQTVKQLNFPLYSS
jgi:TRAP-type C4-dicarboxylate transport system substrate-binding protein